MIMQKFFPISIRSLYIYLDIFAVTKKNLEVYLSLCFYPRRRVRYFLTAFAKKLEKLFTLRITEKLRVQLGFRNAWCIGLFKKNVIRSYRWLFLKFIWRNCRKNDLIIFLVDCLASNEFFLYLYQSALPESKNFKRNKKKKREMIIFVFTNFPLKYLCATDARIYVRNYFKRENTGSIDRSDEILIGLSFGKAAIYVPTNLMRYPNFIGRKAIAFLSWNLINHGFGCCAIWEIWNIKRESTGDNNTRWRVYWMRNLGHDMKFLIQKIFDLFGSAAVIAKNYGKNIDLRFTRKQVNQKWKVNIFEARKIFLIEKFSE